MKTNVNSVQNEAANGLALVRVTIGSMFVWVFFENLGKGLYTPAGYAGLITTTSRRVTRRLSGRRSWAWRQATPRSRLPCRP